MTLKELNEELKAGTWVFPPIDSVFKFGSYVCVTHSHQVYPGRINVEIAGCEHLQAVTVGYIDSFLFVPEADLAKQWHKQRLAEKEILVPLI